jgi:hypothetical protein
MEVFSNDRQKKVRTRMCFWRIGGDAVIWGVGGEWFYYSDGPIGFSFANYVSVRVGR